MKSIPVSELVQRRIKNFTASYLIPFLSVLHENKALHNFLNGGQRLIARRIKSLD